MEKIVITEEEKKALSTYLTSTSEEEEKRMELFIKARTTWVGFLEPLKNFTPEQFAFLLCGWYEVEQPFKGGDWVYNKLVKGYRKIINREITNFTNWNEVPLSYVIENVNRYEKVTEPWKITLLELGRDKPEFKIGDKFDTDVPHTIIKDYHKELAEEAAIEGEMKYFYPVESRIEVKGYDSN